jgi:hypothetical protein
LSQALEPNIATDRVSDILRETAKKLVACELAAKVRTEVKRREQAGRGKNKDKKRNL